MDSKIRNYLDDFDLDIRKSRYRFMDQKVTPDVLAFISDCVLNYSDTSNEPFSKNDIWKYSYFSENVVYIYSKPASDNSTAVHEYDKFTAQPLKALAYAKVLDEKKVGGVNYYTIKNKEILEFIALSDKNAIVFLNEYVKKVLKDSGFIQNVNDYIDTYRSGKFTSANFDNLKTKFDRFMLTNTEINGLVEIHRIFPKVFNVIAYTERVPGSRKGRVTPEPYYYPDLMYNAINFRDIGKLKNVTRQERGEISKSVQEYGDYEMSKAMTFVRKRHTPHSEVDDELSTGNATQVHHIFPKSTHPSLRSVLENLILLTPSQHYTKAHPNNKTGSVDPIYQLVCLDAKSTSVKVSVDENDGFYSKERFIEVINTGLDTSLEHDSTFDGINSTISALKLKLSLDS